MFTPQERDDLRSNLIEYAKNDECITGAAITGSAAAGREDHWSDIDLAFGVVNKGELSAVIADWTLHLYNAHGALHHVDVSFREWVYRVFLLPNTLQVDLAFVPALAFRATAATFQLLFGKAI